MKQFMKLLAVLAIIVLPFGAAHAESPALKKVEPQFVCMVNNAVFDKPQIPVEVSGKTYYGCCSMCKERLAKDTSVRMATDPVSGKSVDKASAVIGEDAAGAVYYFESEANLKAYTPAQK